MRLTAQAPAKVNRELRVGRRRPDGYHDIRSRIVSIALSDALEVEPADGLEFSCAGLPSPSDDTNLVVRAARALAERLGAVARARIRLEKRVPAGAGLGGGSADAAIALRLLARLWGARLPPEELSDLAASLGSDVPFFLLGGEADVSGRGERVKPVQDRPAVELLLVVPPFSISTREVYEAHSRRGPAADPPASLEIQSSGRFFGPNDLASAVLETHPEMETYLRAAKEAGRESAISGSGSAIALTGAGPEARTMLSSRLPGALLLSTRTLPREEYGRGTSVHEEVRHGDHPGQGVPRR